MGHLQKKYISLVGKKPVLPRKSPSVFHMFMFLLRETSFKKKKQQKNNWEGARDDLMIHLLKPLQIVFFVSFRYTKSALALVILISILFFSPGQFWLLVMSHTKLKIQTEARAALFPKEYVNILLKILAVPSFIFDPVHYRGNNFKLAHGTPHGLCTCCRCRY